MKYEKIYDDRYETYVITPVKEDYDDILPIIRTAWQNVIEAKNWDDFQAYKEELDKCNSILFKAIDKTRRHTRQTSEAYKNHRRNLPSYYSSKSTGNPIGRPKIRDDNYWKEYKKKYYYSVVKPKRILSRQNKHDKI